MGKTIRSLAEFQEYYFPNSRLRYLEKGLCDTFGLTHPHQHKLSEDKDNPNIGFIEVAIPRSFHNHPENIIKSFYSKIGFEINQENKIIELKKDDESYWISIFERETSYVIWIRENPLFNISFN